MQPQGYLLFAITIPNFILGALILMRNIKDRVNIFFAMFAFFVGLWSFCLAGFIFAHGEQSALGWAKGYYIAAATIALMFLLFSIAFTNNWKRVKKKHLVLLTLLLLAIDLMILTVPRFLMQGIRYHSWGKEVILNSNGYLLYIIYFITYVGLGFLILALSLRKAKGMYRVHLKNIIIGLIIAFGLGATFNLFYPAVGNYQYIWVGPLFTLVYIAVVAYTIVRHRLFDVRLIVARSLGYGFSLITLSALFGFMTLIVLRLFAFSGQANSLTFKQQLIYTMLAALSALTFYPLKRFFDRYTNKVFYRDAYDTQDLLNEFNQVMVSTINLEQLLLHTSETLQKYIKSEYITFGIRQNATDQLQVMRELGPPELTDEKMAQIRLLLKDQNEKVVAADEIEDEKDDLKRLMQESSVSVVTRITADTRAEGVGYILFGHKKSGNMYGGRDLETIEIITNELAIAMQNALQFEEIQKFNVTLQDKIDDATRKLKRTNEKLKQLDETKDEFISMASHQLRTPLTSVKGYLSMVLEGDAGEVNQMQHKLLDQAFISSQRMVYLIADLLNVSRLRTGKFVIEPVACNLADAVEGEVNQLIETAEARGLTLTYKKPENFTTVPLDETKIRQVIMNFMDNAIYYSRDGGHINVDVKDKADNIEYTVSDDGIGVPKAEQHHLFTKFYRAGNAKKARPDGTGLGLFMAKKVVVAQGGNIIFKSEPGKGSVFGFSFQKSKLQALADSINEANEASSSPESVSTPVPTPKEEEKAS